MSAVKRSRTRRLLQLLGLVWLLAIAAAHASDNSKSTLDLCNLFDPVPGSQHAGIPVLENGNVFELLAECGSRPISNTPPPPISASALGLSLQGGAVVPKPPSLQSLKQQLAAQYQVLDEQQTALTNAQATLAIFQAQADPNSWEYAGADNQAEVQSFVQQWKTAVKTDQNLVAQVQNQITQLQAQINAAQ